jgi:spermidine synthase
VLVAQRFLLPILLFTSGLCGISYEILYGRMLANIIGDQFIVSTAVLLTFMLGIGFGALHAHRLWRHLWLIEVIIGLYAVLLALNLPEIDKLLYTHISSIGTSALASISVAAVLLIVPAFSIGISLPVFAGYAHQLRPSREYFANSYSVYNFGAALIVIFIEFWLIRETGIKRAVFYMGALNTLVAICLLLFFRTLSNTVQPQIQSRASGFPRRVLIALAISSIGSAIFQLTAIRLSEMLFGPFRETFAYVLCIILLGIAVGSLLVSRFKIGFTGILVACIVALSWTLCSLPWVMHYFAQWHPVFVDAYWQLICLKFVCISLIALGPATCFGATIPAILNTLNRSMQSTGPGGTEATRSPGYLLFVSSLANASGFLLMCLVLHQRLDYGELLVLIVLLSGASLLVFGAHKVEPGPGHIRRIILVWSVTACLSGTVIGAFTLWNEELLYQGYRAFLSPDAMAERLGKHASSERYKGEQDVLSISRRNGDPFLFINGQISIRLESPKEKTVGAIASVFATDHRKAMVLGVGSGATAGSVALVFDQVRAVEISKIILDNLNRMEKYNFGLTGMDNVTLVHDDAIHAVKVADRDYSLILNTVTSPLFFSSAKLYTTDFLDNVRHHLAPGGLYMTWLDSRVGNTGADIMIETVTRSFEHCGLAQMSAVYLLLLCSDTPVVAHHPHVVEQQEQLARYFRQNSSIDPGGFAYQLLHTNAAALRNPRGAPLNTLDKPMLAFEMSRVIKRNIRQFQKRIVAALNVNNVRSAFTTFDWGLLQMIETLDKVTGPSIYNEIWKRHSNEFNTNYRQGLIAEQEGNCENALKFLEAAYAVDARHPQLNLRLGRCYEKLGAHKEALAAYIRERELHPEAYQIGLVIARTLIWLERYKSAIAELARAPATVRSGGYYYLLARALEGYGDKAQARNQYRTAQSLAGSLPAAARAALDLTGEFKGKEVKP